MIHLEVGQPSTPAPRLVREAAASALESDVLGYTTPLGLPALREAISAHYESWYGVSIPVERVVATAGASGGCVLAFLSAFEPGDRVVVPSPGYPCYRNMLDAFGAEVIELGLDSSTGFVPTPAQLDAEMARERFAGLVLGSPANPTGTMLDENGLRELTAWCDRNGVRFISDEIYHGIWYDAAAPTAAAYSDTAIIINSFSKYFSMTGWRLGWMIVPDDFVETIVRLGANLFISPHSLSQIAAVDAFRAHDELQANVERYRENRRILLDGLPNVGLDRLAPADGAFYIYAAVDHLTDDSQALCSRWLDELSIAVTPGVDFDTVRGKDFVRFSFAGAPDDMHRALDRLATWRP